MTGGSLKATELWVTWIVDDHQSCLKENTRIIQKRSWSISQ
jgi:hypothetical protein